MKDVYLERFAKEGLKYPFLPVHEGYFTADDARLYYASFGPGRPVILLHGGMGNGTNWAGQIESLVGAGYNPIVLDTRGHGRSSSGRRTFCYRLFREDLGLLMDHLQLNEAFLVGWSDGACTALEMARTQPSRVVGVIFFACNVDPSGTREFEMTRAIENCLTRHQLDFGRLTPTLEPFDALQPKLEPMQKNEPNYGLADLQAIGVPVAVLQGDRDEFIRLTHAQFLAAALPQGRLEILEDAGHFAPIEDPTHFNEVLLKSIRLIRENHGEREV